MTMHGGKLGSHDLSCQKKAGSPSEASREELCIIKTVFIIHVPSILKPPRGRSVTMEKDLLE